MLWAVETLNAAVDAEITALPADMQARYLRFVDIIQQAGFSTRRSSILKTSYGNCGSPDEMESHGRST